MASRVLAQVLKVCSMRYVFSLEMTNFRLCVDSETEEPSLVIIDKRDGCSYEVPFVSMARPVDTWIKECFPDGHPFTAEDTDEFHRWATFPSSEHPESSINWHFAERMAYLIRKQDDKS
jgi:hypothetical protein